MTRRKKKTILREGVEKFIAKVPTSLVFFTSFLASEVFFLLIVGAMCFFDLSLNDIRFAVNN